MITPQNSDPKDGSQAISPNTKAACENLKTCSEIRVKITHLSGSIQRGNGHVLVVIGGLLTFIVYRNLRDSLAYARHRFKIPEDRVAPRNNNCLRARVILLFGFSGEGPVDQFVSYRQG
jgi:hypothetical protein